MTSPTDTTGLALDGALEAALTSLTDQRATVPPIQAEEFAARRERLAALLRDAGLDGMLMESCATMSYLTGMRWGRSERLFGLVVLADGSAFWICPAFEERRASELIHAPDGPGGDVVTWQEHEHPYAPLAAELTRRGARRIAVEPELRAAFVYGLGERVGLEHLVHGYELRTQLRARKDEHELALLRRANEITQQALIATAQLVREGMTETEIARIVTRAQERMGLTDIWNLTLIGPSGAFPHGVTGDRPLSRGDVLLIDTGGALHGYQSDNTRTWVFDAAPDKDFERAWHAVRDAQRAAFDALRPGAPCGAVDRAARESLERAGYGPGYQLFQHRLGHGIGVQGHEDPYFDGGSEVPLEPGMTFSNEPGVYLPGEFGCRIEDIVVCTEDGADHFGEWQKGPRSPA